MRWLWERDLFGRIASGIIAGALVAAVLLACQVADEPVAQASPSPEEIEITSPQKKPEISDEINSKLEGFKAEVYSNTSACVPRSTSFCCN